MKQAPFHIAVSGLIGAGKSTLVAGLAPLLDARPLLERFDRNPFLARFYAEPRRWAFQSFVFFFEQSLDDELSARRDEVSAIQERVIEEHLQVFAHVFRDRGYLESSELELLSRLAATSGGQLAPSDLLLHVDIDPAQALRRIRARALPEERAIDLDYLQELNLRYERFVEAWSDGPVLRVQADTHDLRDQGELRALAMKVEDALGVSARI